MKVAILGPRGTFSEEAARIFSPDAELQMAGDIPTVFEKLESGDCEYGIVPVENSLEGPVGITLELLLERQARIYGEVVVDIHHALLALPGTGTGDLREVISHPHALAQCKGFLKELGVKTRNFPSTAGAAREVGEKGLAGTGAIAPRGAAELYGLAVLEEDIQDVDANQTRFLVISREDHPPTGRDKTSVVIGLKDRPGALYQCLGVFAKRGINLTRIESRPSRKALGDYLFFIDFEGHREDPHVAEVLEELEGSLSFLRVLGSYPRFGQGGG
ncbi:MAG: prephenate dehydratase [Euryarchaeota archaeon]|nr:prephenate dehydratase [Euryarchaeota archaeon]